MLTNRQIHDMAEQAYTKRRTGVKHVIGYAVRWDVRNSTTGEVVGSHGMAETDVAGYMYKADAMRIIRVLVAEGYTGVRLIKSYYINDRRNYDDTIGQFSPDYDTIQAEKKLADRGDL